MSDPDNVPTRTTPAPRRVPDETVRARCASPAAADYTLFMRDMVDKYTNQAGIIDRAERRGVKPPLTRQALSEQLTGGYRNGPKWPMVEVIVDCLPEEEATGQRLDKARLKAQAAGWYRAARKGRPPGYHGPVIDPPTGAGHDRDSEGELVGEDALRAQVAQLTYLREQEGRRAVKQATEWKDVLTTERQRSAHWEDRAENMEQEFMREREARLAAESRARNMPRLLEAYARLCADQQRATVPADAVVASGRHGPLEAEVTGRPLYQIDPSAPPPTRALAAYLGAYAEYIDLPAGAVATRAGLRPAVLQHILGGHRLPSHDELAGLVNATGADPATATSYLMRAEQHAAGSAFDEIVSNAFDAGPHAATVGEPPVGTRSDNPVQNPDNVPTPPGGRPVTGTGTPPERPSVPPATSRLGLLKEALWPARRGPGRRQRPGSG